MANEKVKLLTTDHLQSIFNKNKKYADKKVNGVSDMITIRPFDGVYSNRTEAESNWREGKIFFIAVDYAFFRCVNTDEIFEDAGEEYNGIKMYIPPVGGSGGIIESHSGLTANNGLYMIDSGEDITFYRVSDSDGNNRVVIRMIDLVVDEAPPLVIKLSDSANFLRENCDTGVPVSSKKPDGTKYDLKIEKFFHAFLKDPSITNTWKWANIQFVTGCNDYPLFWRILTIDNTDAESITLYIQHDTEQYVVTIAEMDKFMMRGFEISIYSSI